MLWILPYLFGVLAVTAEVPGKFNVTVSPGPITAPVGSSVILPCAVTPSFSVLPYKVLWHRPGTEKTTVLHFENHKIREKSADPQYRGRASLVGDLEKGDASLKLENLTLADRGGYVCIVNSFIWYDKAEQDLHVQVVGSTPILSYTEVGTGQVNVTCVSGGWSPQPTLTWRHKHGHEIRSGSAQVYSTDSAGLVSVSSWVLFSASKSEWISCSVYLLGEKMRESRLLPHTIYEDNASPWRASFITILVLALLAVGLLFLSYHKGYISFAMKGNADRPASSPTERGIATGMCHVTCGVIMQRHLHEGTENDPNKGECVRSETKLQTTEMSTNTLTQEMAEKSTTTNAQIIRKAGRETILGDIVQLTLDEKTAPGFLKVETKANGQLVTCKDPGKMAAQGTQHPHVLCKERLSSHQHYWAMRGESFLGKLPDLLSRQSWYVGVCTSTAAESKVKLDLTPENGYWILQYKKGTGLSTNSEPTFPTSGRNDHIYVLGVHLDCDNNTLTFYNSDEDTHICTFYNIPPLKTFIPLICPGVSDGDLMYFVKNVYFQFE